MTYLKLLSLGGLAVIAVLFAGVSTGSATVLCKTTTTPCNSAYEKESVVSASLTGTAVLRPAEGANIATCSSGSAEATITVAGGEASKVSGNITALTWGGCSTTVHTIALGSLSVEHIAGTDNGTVVGTNAEVTVAYKGVSCTYGTGGAGTHLGILRGRNNPIIEISTTVAKTAGGFECPSTAAWYANYTLSEALYVEPNGAAWCKTTSTPCGASYEAGVSFKAAISGSTFLETLEGSTMSTCTGGTMEGAVTTDGGNLGSVPIPLESQTWSGCTSTTVSIRLGELDFTRIGGTDNASVTYTGTEVTYAIFGVSCGYGGNGGAIGTFKGGEKPVIEVNAKLTKSSGGFLCPKEARWTAEYKVEEPTPLYVETS